MLWGKHVIIGKVLWNYTLNYKRQALSPAWPGLQQWFPLTCGTLVSFLNFSLIVRKTRGCVWWYSQLNIFDTLFACWGLWPGHKIRGLIHKWNVYHLYLVTTGHGSAKMRFLVTASRDPGPVSEGLSLGTLIFLQTSQGILMQLDHKPCTGGKINNKGEWRR